MRSSTRPIAPYDNLCLSVTLKAEGSIDKVVVASMAETQKMDPA